MYGEQDWFDLAGILNQQKKERQERRRAGLLGGRGPGGGLLSTAALADNPLVRAAALIFGGVGPLAELDESGAKVAEARRKQMLLEEQESQRADDVATADEAAAAYTRGTSVPGVLMPSAAQKKLRLLSLKPRVATGEDGNLGYSPSGRQLLESRGAANLLQELMPERQSPKYSELFWDAYNLAGGDKKGAEKILNTWRESPGTNIYTGDASEKERDKRRGGNIADSANEVDSAAKTARDKLPQLHMLRMALENPDVYQGTFGESVAAIKRAGRTLLGMDFEGVADSEVLRVVGDELALSLKDSMKGSMSDSDREFMRNIPPGLSRSREGNMALLSYLERMAERAMTIQELQTIYEAEHNGLDANWQLELNDYVRNNPIFTQEDYDEVKRIASESAIPLIRLPSGNPEDSSNVIQRGYETLKKYERGGQDGR